MKYYNAEKNNRKEEIVLEAFLSWAERFMKEKPSYMTDEQYAVGKIDIASRVKGVKFGIEWEKMTDAERHAMSTPERFQVVEGAYRQTERYAACLAPRARREMKKK